MNEESLIIKNTTNIPSGIVYGEEIIIKPGYEENIGYFTKMSIPLAKLIMKMDRNRIDGNFKSE